MIEVALAGPELDTKDIIAAWDRLPLEVLAALSAHPRELILAGGYLRSIVLDEPINDIDLFTTSQLKAHEIAVELAGKTGKIFATSNAYTITLPNTPKIQIIHRWTFATPEEVIGSFDFTISQAAIWIDTDGWRRSIRGERFYMDVDTKQLVYRSPTRNEDSGGSYHRVIKFIKKGYLIDDTNMGKVMARLFTEVAPELSEKVTAPSITTTLQKARRTRY